MVIGKLEPSPEGATAADSNYWPTRRPFPKPNTQVCQNQLIMLYMNGRCIMIIIYFIEYLIFLILNYLRKGYMNLRISVN